MGLATYKSKYSNQHGLNIFLSLKIKKSHRIVDNIICLLSISKRKENNLKTEFYWVLYPNGLEFVLALNEAIHLFDVVNST